MFAFQLPFGSLNEARHALFPLEGPIDGVEVAPPPAVRPEASPAAPGKTDGAVVTDLGPTSSASAASFADERLLAMVADALRDLDCGVVVCSSVERAPSLLLLGRRKPMGHSRATAIGTNADGTTVDGTAARACDRFADADRSLLTMLFTDIVASTEMAERLGDEAWRRLLDRHRVIVREQLEEFRGVEVDNAGDGFFATFTTPARALRCAEAIDAELARIGLSMRAGVHAGECAVTEGHVTGVAVHVAARIVEIARPGEVLVSATVRDLVAGSGLEFCDRDWHVLRGLSGSRQLYALQRTATR